VSLRVRRIAPAWCRVRDLGAPRRGSQRRREAEAFARLARSPVSSRQPVITDGALVAGLGVRVGGSVPAGRAVAWRGGPALPARRPVAAMRATSGEPRFWLVPDADSLSAAWARLFAPLVAPARACRPRSRRRCASRRARSRWPWGTDAARPTRHVARDPASRTSFAARRLGVAGGDSLGHATRFEGFLLGRFGPSGPELHTESPPTLDRPPQLLVGMGDTIPGTQRLWAAAGHLAWGQELFIEHKRDPPRLERVYLTWGTRSGDGPTPAAALRDLLRAGPPGAVDTSSAPVGSRRGGCSTADSARSSGTSTGRARTGMAELLGRSAARLLRPPHRTRLPRRADRPSSSRWGNAVAPAHERPTISNQFRHTRESGPASTWPAPVAHRPRARQRAAGRRRAGARIRADHLEPLLLGVLVAPLRAG
jgi:hypothetical protein